MSSSVGKISGSLPNSGSSFLRIVLDAVDRRHVLDVLRDVGRVLGRVRRSSGTRARRRCSEHRSESPPGRRRGRSRRWACRHSTLSLLIRDVSPDQPIAATMLPLVRSSVYSLPVKRRICPESRAARSLSIAASQSSLVASSTLIPSLCRISGTVSRHLGQHRHLALVLGVEQVRDRVDLGRLVGVDEDPGLATLPGDRELALRVGRRLLELREDVVEHRLQVVVVDLLQIAEVVHPLRHPVGDDEEAATAGARPDRAAASAC